MSKISEKFTSFNVQQRQELADLFSSVLTDLTVLQAAADALATKLNADATAQNIAVASSQLDTDYAAPAALVTEA